MCQHQQSKQCLSRQLKNGGSQSTNSRAHTNHTWPHQSPPSHVHVPAQAKHEPNSGKLHVVHHMARCRAGHIQQNNTRPPASMPIAVYYCCTGVKQLKCLPKSTAPSLLLGQSTRQTPQNCIVRTKPCTIPSAAPAIHHTLCSLNHKKPLLHQTLQSTFLSSHLTT